MHYRSFRQVAFAALVFISGQVALADLGIEVNNVDSLKQAGKAVAAPMMEFYKQNQTEGIPGKLTGTWYVAGSMFMTLIQFWQASGDDTYNSVVSHDLMFQAGENYDYQSKNVSQWLGNDDQMFWALAAITASESGFPEISGKPSWTSLARVVFNLQVERWDNEFCHGGMRWQLWPYQGGGYRMKNAISNGGLFELAARLARFTKNETYAEWADKIWDWSASTPLLQTDPWYIADSTSNENNCTDAGNQQWSYNYGTYLAGAAFMYNHTNGAEKWLKRVDGLLNSVLTTFFPKEGNGLVLSEVACEPILTCDRNQLGFKGYVAMWLAFTAIMVPSTRDLITPKLQGSAAAISKQCSGGTQNLCGERWYSPEPVGPTGLEVQMAALGGITGNLMLFEIKSPKTIENNPDATEHEIEHHNEQPNKPKPITTGDRAGAGVATAVLVIFIAGTVTWMVTS
ncbi:glycoside hydrolase family 76 protein [Aspergillus alliaceus]|uniref:Mannan endo-1,6-alpha-mannosidase n=1 Tax=Petromyces alliaceus TaxID=209559 RepID=A0A5N7CPL2_PETAA|nr:glycoside hydrolase family 76 protein [Aspergillus alliaceus]